MPYFDRVQRFCFFIAPARSGHSLVAHLLTAHPDVLISDELHALRYFAEGYTADQVYALIRAQNMYLQRRQRSKSGYNYSVEGTAQDDPKKHPLVIGDAKGEGSMKLLVRNQKLIDRIREEVGIPLRAIVHIRHPFDITATNIRRRQTKLSDAISIVIDIFQKLQIVVDQLREEEFMLQRQEDLIADPKGQFEKLFRFLDVEPTPEIVTACANKIWRAPHLTRKSIDWEPNERKRLIEAMRKSQFFAPYVDAHDQENAFA
jgi:hypothetical protein